jgi:hypothetical protein
MIILEHVYNKDDILEINTFQNGFVKGVVDIEEELVALDADMHYQLADYLKEKCDSKEENLWGFNLWLENDNFEDILEYDSLINIHNNQIHGFPRGGMSILDSSIEQRATEVIKKWIQI